MPFLLKVLLAMTAVAAACYDLRIRRIPNWLNLSGLLLGLGLNLYFESLHGLMSSAGGLLLALCIYIPLYALRGMGAGDVKLMAAIGAMVGPSNWLNIFLMTALLGGLISLLLVVVRRRSKQTFLNLAVIVSQLTKGKRPADQDAELTIYSQKALKMPHGAVIASGVLLSLTLHWAV